MTDSPARPVSRYTEVRSTRENPSGTVEPLMALRVVMLYTLTDTFGLVPEESMWVGYHLDRILAPLIGREPQRVALAVRQEMLEGTYTQALNDIEASRRADSMPLFDPSVVHANHEDWAAVLMQTITACYPMRPMDESMMRGQIIGLLRELGIGDPANPRGARYLPNDLRHRMTGPSGQS